MLTDPHSIINALAALAQEHRLAIFRLLVQSGDAGMAAGAIADAMHSPASSLSFHLAHMERAGIIIRTRRGRSLVYTANYAAMTVLVGYLTENCCGFGTQLVSAACPPSLERPTPRRTAA